MVPCTIVRVLVKVQCQFYQLKLSFSCFALSSVSKNESWVDYCSSGSEHLPENSSGKKWRSLAAVHISCDSDTKNTSCDEKQRVLIPEVPVKRRLNVGTGESSKALDGSVASPREGVNNIHNILGPNNQVIALRTNNASCCVVDYSSTSSSESESEKAPNEVITNYPHQTRFGK